MCERERERERERGCCVLRKTQILKSILAGGFILHTYKGTDFSECLPRLTKSGRQAQTERVLGYCARHKFVFYRMCFLECVL